MHGRDLPREQDTPDDPMQGHASIYDLWPALSRLLFSLSPTLDVDYIVPQLIHSLLLPNWLGCLHSLL